MKVHGALPREALQLAQGCPLDYDDAIMHQGRHEVRIWEWFNESSVNGCFNEILGVSMLTGIHRERGARTGAA